jgi:hypothetical protein
MITAPSKGQGYGAVAVNLVVAEQRTLPPDEEANVDTFPRRPWEFGRGTKLGVAALVISMVAGFCFAALDYNLYVTAGRTASPLAMGSITGDDLQSSSPTNKDWSNPPSKFDEHDGQLSFLVPGQTDYWRITYLGFIRDNGPFYYQPHVSGDFTAVVKFSGDYGTLYDQAGLMVRESSTTWMKCGVEFTNGTQHASTVITRDYSDWSIVPIPSNPATIWFKAQRTKECIETFYSLDGVAYTQIRQGYLSTAESLEVGIVAAAPIGHGFVVTFEEFAIIQ